MGKDDRPKSPPPRDRSKRGNPLRHTPNKKSKAPSGPWTNRYVKCRHCGGTHWHRDCPKRHKARANDSQPSKGRAALATADAKADENLDAAIGNVLLAADAQS
eukprot:113268-Pleurochrysis_carterae.AAC.2